MTNKREPGHYEYGRISQHDHERTPRPSYCGEFGVIKSEIIAESSHLEWRPFCSGVIKKNKWVAYRRGAGDNGSGLRTDLLKAFDTKKAAINWLEGGYKGYDYTELY